MQSILLERPNESAVLLAMKVSKVQHTKQSLSI